MSGPIRAIVAFTRRHPISRGMIAYAILWPTSNVTQQVMQQRESINWKEAARFSLFGAGYTAPTLYAWVRIAGYLVPGNSLRVALTKTLLDQILYAPFAICGFYLGLGILEGKTWDLAVQELKDKYIPTYKAGACVWPLVQTLNFLFIKERNRVMVTGTVSFFWTIWMSYMKSLEVDGAQHSPPSIVKCQSSASIQPLAALASN